MLDALLPNVADEESLSVTAYLQRVQEACQLARLRNKNQQAADSRHYNLQRSSVEYEPGDCVWILTPLRHRGLSETLL